jgi:transposase-like protein
MKLLMNVNFNEVSEYLTEIRETKFSEGNICPHCMSTRIRGHGKYRGRQRYMCKNCGKTFNDMSCTPLAGIHKPEKFGQYIKFMLTTSFYWRHKVLNALCNLDIEKLYGVVESDEKYFIESFKGKKKNICRKPKKRGTPAKKRGISNQQACVLVAMDRNGHIISGHAGMGLINAKQIDSIIGTYISNDSTLCSDSSNNYINFAKLKGLAHVQVNASKKMYVINSIYHIQHVNSYHGKLESFINGRFRGVATKYIDNYLFWHRFLELHKSYDKVELEKILLIKIFASSNSTTVADLRAA